MSVSRECSMIELDGKDWYYLLENEYGGGSKCVGPFTSEDVAWEHLMDYNCNPGGSYTERYTTATLPQTLRNWIDNATRRESF